MAAEHAEYTDNGKIISESFHGQEQNIRKVQSLSLRNCVVIGYIISAILVAAEGTMSQLRPLKLRDGSKSVVIWTNHEYMVPSSNMAVQFGVYNTTERCNMTYYNSTLLQDIYESTQWSHGISDAGFLSDDVILVNCSTAVNLWMSASSTVRQCLCYGDESVVIKSGRAIITPTHCDHPLTTHLHYASILYGIVQQGTWTNVMVISDNPLQSPVIWSDDYYINKKVVFPCSVGHHEVGESITDMHYTNDDFWNIVFYCDNQTTIGLLQKVLALELVIRRVRFNIVLINITPSHFHDVQRSLRDGDNAVLLNMPPHDQMPQHVIKHDNFTLIYDAVRINLYWCYTDCFLGNTPHYMGSFSTHKDITSLSNKLLPAKFSQFYGRHLVVVCEEYRPFCVTEGAEDGSSRVVGIEIEIVKALSVAYNFTYHTVNSPDHRWGGKNPDGTWNGMVGVLTRKEAALAISGITISAAREEGIDFLHAHWEDPSAIIVKLNPNKWNYFTETFSLRVWGLVFLTPAFISVVLLTVNMINIRIRRPRINMTNTWAKQPTTEWKPLIKEFACSLQLYMFRAYGDLMLQGAPLPALFGSSRFVIAFFWFTIIMLTSVFSGNLTATLAVKKVEMPFDTLEELANDPNYILQITKGTFRELLFNTSTHGTYQKLWAKISQNPVESFAPSRQAAYQKVLKGGYTYSADKTALWEWIKQGGDCDVAFLPEFYFMSGFGIMVPEGSPYKEKFDKVIVNLLEMGFIEVWNRNYSTPDVCSNPSSATVSEAVTLHDVTYVLLFILCLGLFVATVTLVFECIWRAFRRKAARSGGCIGMCQSCGEVPNRSSGINHNSSNGNHVYDSNTIHGISSVTGNHVIQAHPCNGYQKRDIFLNANGIMKVESKIGQSGISHHVNDIDIRGDCDIISRGRNIFPETGVQYQDSYEKGFIRNNIHVSNDNISPTHSRVGEAAVCNGHLPSDQRLSRQSRHTQKSRTHSVKINSTFTS